MYIKLLILGVFFPVAIFSQIGGKAPFQFLNVSDNAHVMGLGGHNVSTADDDHNMSVENPATLDTLHGGNLSINYLPYFTTINKTSLLYSFNREKTGAWLVGSTYNSYGRFDETDPTGQVTGDFKASDYRFFVTKSHQVNNFKIGATLNLAGSQIAGYSSNAFTFDLGGVFKHPVHDLQIGLVFKNIGFVFNKFIKGTEQTLPADLRLGVSYKLEHVPLRVSLTGVNLLANDVYYFDSSRNSEFDADGNVVESKKKFSEQIFRRLIWGFELIFSKQFQVRAGYNHQRRKELKIDEKGGLSGFSLGANMKLKGYNIAFTRAWYSLAGGTSVLTLNTNLNRYFYKQVNKLK